MIYIFKRICISRINTRLIMLFVVLYNIQLCMGLLLALQANIIPGRAKGNTCGTSHLHVRKAAGLPLCYFLLSQ